MRFLIQLIIIVLAFTLSLNLQSCSKFQQSKRHEAQRRRQFEKDKIQREKEAQQAYEDAIKKHYDAQDSGTKKMMRQTARKSQVSSEHKKANFLQRWFTPKQKKTKSKRNIK